MTGTQAVTFLVFAAVAAGTPGPSNALLTATGAQVGVRRGLPCWFGVTIGMSAMMFAVAFGLGSAILGHPLVLEIVKWCGAALLCWLAWKIASASPAAHGDDGPRTERRTLGFWSGAAFQWVNPKAWLVAASASATFLDRHAGGAAGQAAALAGLFLVAALPGCFPWLLFGAVAHHVLRTARARRALNIGMGAVLAASVVLFVWPHP